MRGVEHPGCMLLMRVRGCRRSGAGHASTDNAPTSPPSSRGSGVVHGMPLFELIWTPRAEGKAGSHARRGGSAALSIEAHPTRVETREVCAPLDTETGISHIGFIDFDYFTLSSFSQHATVGLADVGTLKSALISYSSCFAFNPLCPSLPIFNFLIPVHLQVQCVARALRQIATFVDVEACADVWKHDGEGGEGPATDLKLGLAWPIGSTILEDLHSGLSRNLAPVTLNIGS
ncbi:hypothetical protein K438DRAFT_1966606 [Mycena galopus ATCC 62051]|nr:hypothetical protein K438DRAFT_1966606 [Mycena galopus ATCC 62051]